MSKVVSTSITRPVRKASARISLVDWTVQINWVNWNLQHEALMNPSTKLAIISAWKRLGVEWGQFLSIHIHHLWEDSLARINNVFLQQVLAWAAALWHPLTASSFNSELKDSPTEHQIHKACLWLVFQSLQLIYLICLSFGWFLLHVFQEFKQMTKIYEFHSTSVRPISMPMVLLCSCPYWPITAYHSMPRRWWVAQVRSGWSWVSLPCNGCGYWAQLPCKWYTSHNCTIWNGIVTWTEDWRILLVDVNS